MTFNCREDKRILVQMGQVSIGELIHPCGVVSENGGYSFGLQPILSGLLVEALLIVSDTTRSAVMSRSAYSVGFRKGKLTCRIRWLG